MITYKPSKEEGQEAIIFANTNKPSEEEAREAVKLLIRYIGDNPDREGLKETPRRVIKSYQSFFKGYEQNAEDILSVTFSEIEEYEEPINLTNIGFQSYCEHHMLPITGFVNISYIHGGRVVGISKLARIVDLYSNRLQLQERLTNQIGKALDQYLKPKGVAVYIAAQHACLSCRGVSKPSTLMSTCYFSGLFKTQDGLKDRFLDI